MSVVIGAAGVVLVLLFLVGGVMQYQADKEQARRDRED